MSEAKRVYYCFGCGAKGSLVDLYAYLRNMSFIDAIQDLSTKYGVVLGEEDGHKRDLLRIIGKLYEATTTHVKKSNLFTLFLEARGIPYELAAEARLGYWPIGDWWRKYNDFSIDTLKELGLATYSKPILEMRMIFPIKNWQGEVISLAGREIQSLKKVDNKYINGADSVLYNKSRTFYGTPISRSSKEKVVIAEGYFDQMALKDLGYNALAICGTAFTTYHASYLRHREEVVLMFDNDHAGSRARTEATKILFQAGIAVKWGYVYEGKDALDCYIADKEKLRQGVENAIDPFDYLIAFLKKRIAIEDKQRVWETAKDLASHLINPFDVAKAMEKINKAAQVPNLPGYVASARKSIEKSPLLGDSLAQAEGAVIYHAIQENKFVLSAKWAITNPEYQKIYSLLQSGGELLDIEVSESVRSIFANKDLAGVSHSEIILNLVKTWFEQAKAEWGYGENASLLDRVEELASEAEDSLIDSNEIPKNLEEELRDQALQLWQKYLGIQFAKDEIANFPFASEKDIATFIQVVNENKFFGENPITEIEKLEALMFTILSKKNEGDTDANSDSLYLYVFKKLYDVGSPMALEAAKKIRSDSYRSEVTKFVVAGMVDLNT